MMAVVVALSPSDQGEKGEDLGLDSERDVERLADVVYAEGDAGGGPEEHHGGLEASGVVATVVEEDLGEELDGPAEGA